MPISSLSRIAMRPHAIAAVGLSCLIAAVPHGQDKPPGPALSPSEAVAKMTVPEGFSVELVAAEPQIVNPVAMTFDERGRIWVTESFEYPRTEAGVGKDRVKVLEDTDRDGRVDKVTIFAEGLNIPSGIAVGYGGVWVANAPDLLYMQDTDGDGKADKTEVVVTGFGRTDTHELPNSLTWGPDGWLYGLNGVFNHSHIKYRGKQFDFTCALFRIHPRTREFEIFCEGTSNPWGVAWDGDGSAFVSACVIDHLWHLVETGYYHRQGGPYPPFTWKIDSIVKHKHQKAAYCGIHYFDSDAYPAEYREKLYMGNIHGNCLNVDTLERSGSTYFAKGEPDFLSANDSWFMPVVQKTGPDGCLYVLDWYDQYHCYQDARRDPAGIERAKGRLYRVRYRETPRAPQFDLSRASDQELIERLRSPNVFFRDLAQRILGERNSPEAKTRLQQLASNRDEPRKARMHALWTLIGMRPLEPAFHERLLSDEDPAFRAWGVRAAGNMKELESGIRERVLALVDDRAPEVKLQLAIASRKIVGAAPLPLLLKILQDTGDDPLLPRVVWQNLHPLLEKQSLEFLSWIEQDDRAKSPNLAAILPRAVERILGRQHPDRAPIAQLFDFLSAGKHRDPTVARQMLKLLASRVQSGEVSGESLKRLKASLQPAVDRILAAPADDPLHIDAALLAATWNDPGALAAVRRILVTADQPDARRIQALGAMIAVKDSSVLDSVVSVLEPKSGSSAELRSQIVAALGRLDDPRVADVLLRIYPTLEPDLQPKAIEVLTERSEWAKALLAAIGKKQVAPNAINVNQVRKLLAGNDAAVKKLVVAQWGTLRESRDPQRELVIATMRNTIRKTEGDARRGHEAFKKVCGQCHKIYGEGNEVGPDITENGRSSFEQLLSNVFDPSLVIGASYQARIVVTTEGRVLSGLVVEDTEDRIVLKIQGGKQEVVPRSDVEESKVSEQSLMPEGLEKQMKPEEIADLFAFLTLDRPPDDPRAKQLPGVREVIPRETTDPARFGELIGEVLPGFGTQAVGERGVGVLREHMGRTNVIRTLPVRENVPCVLSRTVEIPADKKSTLKLAVSHHSKGDWQLIVRADGKELFSRIIGPETTKSGWADIDIDLTPFAGKQVKLDLLNQSKHRAYEFAFWGRAEIVSE